MEIGHPLAPFVKVGALAAAINLCTLYFTTVNCGLLTDPTNGQVDTSSGTTFGSTATYTCDTGYTLSGSQSRTCRADGNWTSTEPLCRG